MQTKLIKNVRSTCVRQSLSATRIVQLHTSRHWKIQVQEFQIDVSHWRIGLVDLTYPRIPTWSVCRMTVIFWAASLLEHNSTDINICHYFWYISSWCGKNMCFFVVHDVLAVLDCHCDRVFFFTLIFVIMQGPSVHDVVKICVFVVHKYSERGIFSVVPWMCSEAVQDCHCERVFFLNSCTWMCSAAVQDCHCERGIFSE